jgi:mono/diheme cytochrome c family protein
MTIRGVLGGLLLGLVFTPGLSAAEQPKPASLGDKVPRTSSLRDLRGNRRPLHDFKGNKALVLAFLGTECPISNLYAPELIKLEKQYHSQQVQFLAIYANEGDDLDRVAMHSYDRGIPFPVLKDAGQRLADALDVTRVPTVLVLDADFRLQYRGRVDDRYGAGSRRPKTTRNDLAEALKEVLAGKKVSVAETESDGCQIEHGEKAAARKDITYHKQVARILQKNCQTCHRPGQATPFSLLSYDDAVRHARMIKEVTTQRRMPPWHADPRYGHFANDRRMNKADIDTLAAWVDSGMPRGNPTDGPKPIPWLEDWKFGKPDRVFSMPEAFEVPATGVLSYKYFTVETNFKEDRWVKTAEARPGAAGVVHHVVVYLLSGNQRRPFSRDGTMSVLVGWAPGDLGLNCPPDIALRIPKGARLLFELHYTPNGTAAKDRSSVGIVFARKPPKYELLMNAFVNEGIHIPPQAQHHREEATLRIRGDARLISFVPHMHWRGKDYYYEAIYPDGKKETLLSVPRWDFNWQSVYQFKEAIRLPKGSRIHAVAHWDNSRNNPLNPDPSKDVYFGLQTWDEMMVGWAAYVWERPETAAELARNPPSDADLFFDRLDTNGDEVVTREEVPDRLKLVLLATGVKTPEKMRRKEFVAFYEELRKRFPRPRVRPGNGNPKPRSPDKQTKKEKPGG